MYNFGVENLNCLQIIYSMFVSISMKNYADGLFYFDTPNLSNNCPCTN